MNLKHLKKKVAKLSPPPARCRECDQRPTIALTPADAGDCPACGKPFTGVEIIAHTVAGREQLAQARAALPSGANVLDDKGPTPAGLLD